MSKLEKFKIIAIAKSIFEDLDEQQTGLLDLKECKEAFHKIYPDRQIDYSVYGQEINLEEFITILSGCIENYNTLY
ncbi:hypothetical protein pb186bvf_015823 [Paramecium bursaria]